MRIFNVYLDVNATYLSPTRFKLTMNLIILSLRVHYPGKNKLYITEL